MIDYISSGTKLNHSFLSGVEIIEAYIYMQSQNISQVAICVCNECINTGRPQQLVQGINKFTLWLHCDAPSVSLHHLPNDKSQGLSKFHAHALKEPHPSQ